MRFVADIRQQVSVTHERQNDERQIVEVERHSNQRQNIRMIELLHAQSLVDEPSHFHCTRP